MERADPPDTRLRGLWLGLARLVWAIVVILALGLIGAGMWRATTIGSVAWESLSRTELGGLSSRLALTYYIALQSAVTVGFFAIAALIVWRRSSDWMALFVSLMLVMVATTITILLLPLPAAWHAPVRDIVLTAGMASLLTFFYLFPDGRFVPGWTRLLAVVWLVWLVLWWYFPRLMPLTLRTDDVPILVWVVWYATGAVAQLYRYLHVSGPLQRQQTKWIVVGFTAPIVMVPLGTATLELVSDRWYATVALVTVLALVVLVMPLSIGISILRYRLWAIDVLINRALVYGTLTGSLGLVYLSSVVLLQQGFRWLTGQTSQVVIVVSTLAIAALFQPLRQRIQVSIDRRFYRRKYDAARTLATFSAHVRDEVDLQTLRADVVAVVEQTMQPTHVSLWLRDASPKGR